MLAIARSGGRRRWLLVAFGLALAALIVVTAVIALSGDDSSASRAPSTTVALSSARVSTSSTPPASASSSVMLPGGRPDSGLVGGQTNHLEFARAVAQALLAYGPSTDFNARNEDLLRASAPAPYGDSARLAQDLTAFTPSGPALESMRRNGTTVTVELTDVRVSAWAANRLAGIGASPGVYGIDITGEQTVVTTKGGVSTVVPVQLGVTVACPPATTRFCTLDGVLPAHLQDALGSK